MCLEKELCYIRKQRMLNLDSYDENATVEEALAVYFEKYGLGDGGYDKAFHLVLLFKVFPLFIPNPPARKKALRRHDLNHVLTGCNALPTQGEIDIAGFELGAAGGCGPYRVAWFFNLWAMGMSTLLRKRQVLEMFYRSHGARNAYSINNISAFYQRTLGEVRAELSIYQNASRGTSLRR